MHFDPESSVKVGVQLIYNKLVEMGGGSKCDLGVLKKSGFDLNNFMPERYEVKKNSLFGFFSLLSKCNLFYNTIAATISRSNAQYLALFFKTNPMFLLLQIQKMTSTKKISFHLNSRQKPK